MDKVYCPWCGREMKLGESLPFSGVFAFYCKCGAVSPNEGGAEEALKAALKRPLQKPLTLEEFCDRLCSPVWFESHGTYMGKKGWWMIPQKFIKIDGLMAYGAKYAQAYPKRDEKVLIRFVCEQSSQSSELGLDAYGSVWRAWATKPTDEERAEAKWNE